MRRQTVPDMQARLSPRATTVGVNGDFFQLATGHPTGIFMRDGVISAGPSPGGPGWRSARREPLGRSLRLRRDVAGGHRDDPPSPPAEPAGRAEPVEGGSLHEILGSRDPSRPGGGRAGARRLPEGVARHRPDGNRRRSRARRQNADPGRRRGPAGARSEARHPSRAGARRDADDGAPAGAGASGRDAGRHRRRSRPSFETAGSWLRQGRVSRLGTLRSGIPAPRSASSQTAG